MSTFYQHDPMRDLENQRLVRSLEAGARHADTAERFGREAIETRAEIGAVEDQNRELLERRSVVTNIVVSVVVIGVLGALLLDYGGMGAMADYIAGVTFPDWPLLHTVFRIAFPLAYGGLDLFVGIMLDLARDREKGRRGLVTVFAILATILLVPPVAFMIATHQADVAVMLNANDGTDLSSVFWWKLLGAVALAFVPHAALIFAGHWVRESWAQVRLGRKIRKMNAHATYCDDMARKHELLASTEYVRHVHSWRRLNRNGAGAAATSSFGPFDTTYSALIQRRFGGTPSPDADLPTVSSTPLETDRHSARPH